MANQKLQELLEMKVCDEETAENLVNGGTLVREEIDLIYNSFLFSYGKIITVPFNGRGALKNEMEQNLQNNMNSVPNLILDKLERVLEEIRRQYAENNVAIMNRVFNNPEILKYLRKEIRIEELEDRE